MSDKFKGIKINVELEGLDKTNYELKMLEATLDRILEKRAAIDIAKRVSSIEHMIDGMDLKKKARRTYIEIDGELVEAVWDNGRLHYNKY